MQMKHIEEQRDKRRHGRRIDGSQTTNAKTKKAKKQRVSRPEEHEFLDLKKMIKT